MEKVSKKKKFLGFPITYGEIAKARPGKGWFLQNHEKGNDLFLVKRRGGAHFAVINYYKKEKRYESGLGFLTIKNSKSEEVEANIIMSDGNMCYVLNP